MNLGAGGQYLCSERIERHIGSLVMLFCRDFVWRLWRGAIVLGRYVAYSWPAGIFEPATLEANIVGYASFIQRNTERAYIDILCNK